MSETRGELSVPEVQELEKAIAFASHRSRRIRTITLALLLTLIAVGAFITFTTVQHRKEEQRILAEHRRREEELQARLKADKETRDRLEQQAENSRRLGAYLTAGIYKAGHRQWEGALADYDKALSLDPNNPSALSLKGYLKLRMGDSREGEELLRRAAHGDPDNVWNHYNLALALWANGHRDEALSQLREVLRRDPSFKTTIAQDPQFHGFRSDPGFKKLIKLN